MFGLAVVLDSPFLVCTWRRRFFRSTMHVVFCGGLRDWLGVAFGFDVYLRVSAFGLGFAIRPRDALRPSASVSVSGLCLALPSARGPGIYLRHRLSASTLRRESGFDLLGPLGPIPCRRCVFPWAPRLVARFMMRWRGGHAPGQARLRR